MKRFSFPEILTIIIVIFTSLAILIILGVWTIRLNSRERQNSLEKAMEEVVENGGEKALLEMAGIPTDSVYFGEELLPLYDKENATWKYTKEEARSIAIYNKCKDSVVQILPESTPSSSSNGSGVIISEDGYIITSYHVVSSSSSFVIVFSSGKTGIAVLLGYDVLSDIALLKVDQVGLEPIEFAEDSSLSIGQAVYAIGHPFGYDFSFTSGMISGLDRLVFSSSNLSSVLPGMIQTDALINPGNSGGPLLDSNGRMIGLVSSIYSTAGSAEGISFALPSESVKKVTEALKKDGKVSRGWFDLLSVELNSQIAEYLSLPFDGGILVSQTIPGGKADRGGIRGGKEKAQYGNSIIYLGGDVITKINGVEITSYSTLFSFLFSSHSGDKVDVEVYRNGGYLTLKGVELVEQNEENTKWILR